MKRKTLTVCLGATIFLPTSFSLFFFGPKIWEIFVFSKCKFDSFFGLPPQPPPPIRDNNQEIEKKKKNTLNYGLSILP